MRFLWQTFPQTEATANDIQKMAQLSKDSTLLKNLEDHQTIAYHSNCLTAFNVSLKRQNEEHPNEQMKSGYCHVNRKLYESAFTVISSHNHGNN